MSRIRSARRGVAATELAILLPFLSAIFVIAVDWSRVFYYGVVVENCARNGALYASDPYAPANSPYSSMSAAALSDAGNLSPTPTVSSTSGSDTNGTYVECTVSYSFSTVSHLPFVPKTTQLARKVRVYQAPQYPQ
jgi:Flp pilus assembly protein TadG